MALKTVCDAHRVSPFSVKAKHMAIPSFVEDREVLSHHVPRMKARITQ